MVTVEAVETETTEASVEIGYEVGLRAREFAEEPAGCLPGDGLMPSQPRASRCSSYFHATY